MPDLRLHKTRATLPEGYQYLDAGCGARVILLEADEFIVGRLPENVTVHRKPNHDPVPYDGLMDLLRL